MQVWGCLPTLDAPLAPKATDTNQSGLERVLVLLRARSSLRIGGRTISAADYATRTVLPLLDAAGSGDRERVCGLIARFSWWRDAQLPTNKLLFSAYFTPTVPGSLVRDERFRYPLYRRPPGGAARYTTQQILSGALEGKGLELICLEDAYDALALHVEGAARVVLPDGRALALGTDGHNGHPYTNVSKLLLVNLALRSASSKISLILST